MKPPRRRRSKAAQAAAEALGYGLEARDGPTQQYVAHHDVVRRTANPYGIRRSSQLEQYAAARDLTPEQMAAGARMGCDYTIAYHSGRNSVLTAVLGTTPSWSRSPADHRLNASTRYKAAAAVINGERRAPLAVGHTPSDILTAFVVEDLSMRAIAGRLRRDPKVVKRRVVRYLDTLVEHYAEVDRRSGTSRTPHTRPLALAYFEPKDPGEDGGV